MPAHKILLSILLLALPAPALAGGAEDAPRRPEPIFSLPVWSPDGARIAVTRSGAGVHVYDRGSKAMLTLTDDPSSGYRVRWSPDGRRLAFKVFAPVPGRDLPLQVPVVYDFASGALKRLAAPAQRAGVPTFSASGRLAFTVEDAVVVFDPEGTSVARWDLGEHANLPALSPDGETLAWTADSGLWLLDVRSGRRAQLSAEPGLYDPQWSPDGRRLLALEAFGGLRSFEPGSGRAHVLPRAASAQWLPDGETVVFESNPIPDSFAEAEADVLTVRFDGSRLRPLAAAPGVRETSPAVSVDGRLLAWDDGRRGLVVAPLAASPGPRSLGAAQPLLEVASWSAVDDSAVKSAAAAPPALRALTTSEISGVPYLHQVYDTPDDFNGHWACGPTSSMMAIAYHGALPYWDTTCSTPSSHVSHWGRYISQVYTKGRTFNIGAEDPNGRIFYGAYGYVWQPAGFDTKGHQAELLRYHGLESSVDWSPTWDKLKGEIAKRQPFVILTSITTSGHYKTVIGYATAQHTFILNDPYGNKNSGYMNYYGKRVFYDWPGYSNGFANVKTVHCFIYSRSTAPTTGTLKGTVYKAPNTTAYLAGATVTAGGKTATTNASGAFSFTLAPGTYTVVAKAAGYQDGSVSKAVAAGQTASVALGLYPAEVTGRFLGSVYDAADPTMKTKLTSATVSLDGGPFQPVRASDAVFIFTTKPGPHTVRARFAGYVENSSTRTVVEGGDVWGSIGLSKTATQPAPKVHIESPTANAALDDTSVEVRGTIENSGGVAEVHVKLAGQDVTGAVTGGRFAVPITVPVGTTKIDVVAANSAGSHTASVTVSFKTGLCGIVSAESAVAGAAVELIAASDVCSAALATTQTDAAGRFCIDTAAGIYLLRVKATGYTTAVQTVVVDDLERETNEVTLVAGADLPPGISLVGPEKGADGKAHVTEPTVNLAWRTTGLDPIETRLNGEVIAPAEADGSSEGNTVLVAAGVPVQVGENTFTLEVKGRCGERATASLVVVRDATTEPEPEPGADAGVFEGGPDAGTPASPGDGGVLPMPIVPEEDDGCGCGGPGSPLPLAALALLAALRRRRARD